MDKDFAVEPPLTGPRSLVFEEGLQYFCSSHGVEVLSFLLSRKISGRQFFLGAETAQSLILKIDGNVQ